MIRGICIQALLPLAALVVHHRIGSTALGMRAGVPRIPRAGSSRLGGGVVVREAGACRVGVLASKRLLGGAGVVVSHARAGGVGVGSLHYSRQRRRVVVRDPRANGTGVCSRQRRRIVLAHAHAGVTGVITSFPCARQRRGVVVGQANARRIRVRSVRVEREARLGRSQGIRSLALALSQVVSRLVPGDHIAVLVSVRSAGGCSLPPARPHPLAHIVDDRGLLALWGPLRGRRAQRLEEIGFGREIEVSVSVGSVRVGVRWVALEALSSHVVVAGIKRLSRLRPLRLASS
jgi:hypothetical protein